MTDQTTTPAYDPASGVDPTPEQAVRLGVREAGLLDQMRPGWDERVKQVDDFRRAQAAREQREAEAAAQVEFEHRLDTDPQFRADYQQAQVARQLHDNYWSYSTHERIKMAEAAGRHLRLDTRESADLNALADRLRPAPDHYVRDNDLAVFEFQGRKVVLAPA